MAAIWVCDKKWQNESKNKKFLKYKDYYLEWKTPTYIEMSRDNDQKRKKSPYMELLRNNNQKRCVYKQRKAAPKSLFTFLSLK